MAARPGRPLRQREEQGDFFIFQVCRTLKLQPAGLDCESLLAGAEVRGQLVQAAGSGLLRVGGRGSLAAAAAADAADS